MPWTFIANPDQPFGLRASSSSSLWLIHARSFTGSWRSIFFIDLKSVRRPSRSHCLLLRGEFLRRRARHLHPDCTPLRWTTALRLDTSGGAATWKQRGKEELLWAGKTRKVSRPPALFQCRRNVETIDLHLLRHVSLRPLQGWFYGTQRSYCTCL